MKKIILILFLACISTTSFAKPFCMEGDNSFEANSLDEALSKVKLQEYWVDSKKGCPIYVPVKWEENGINIAKDFWLKNNNKFCVVGGNGSRNDESSKKVYIPSYKFKPIESPRSDIPFKAEVYVPYDVVDTNIKKLEALIKLGLIREDFKYPLCTEDQLKFVKNFNYGHKLPDLKIPVITN
jgi:hypothetical protein